MGVHDDNLACPFAGNPSFTGCDCLCSLPRPRGFWAWLRWLGSSFCITGPGGCGDGSLPCPRYDAWKRETGGCQK